MKNRNVNKYLKKLIKLNSPTIIYAQESSQAIRNFVDPSILKIIQLLIDQFPKV